MNDRHLGGKGHHLKSESRNAMNKNPMNATASRTLSSSSLTGDTVVDAAGEKLGTIDDLMIDLDRGSVAYAVLSVGGLFGMGDKLFAIPWDALRLDTNEKQFVLNINKEKLENAEGFDKDNWPDFADQSWGSKVHSHYGTKPSWG
ncbi:MAG TPA: PRC-barrel domain-containing protein [Gemmatimonadales bacterium]|nr:PRC-barrel domain-containing protein [Gemmatimonadales bacterium]